MYQRYSGRGRTGANVCLAEREGFEPPIRLPVCRISSAVLSTTQPPLQAFRNSGDPASRRGWLMPVCRRFAVRRSQARLSMAFGRAASITAVAGARPLRAAHGQMPARNGCLPSWCGAGPDCRTCREIRAAGPAVKSALQGRAAKPRCKAVLQDRAANPRCKTALRMQSDDRASVSSSAQSLPDEVA